MSLAAADCKKLIQGGFPQGSEWIYDWDNPAADIGQFFTALGGLFKTYGSDTIDVLRNEVNPTTITQNIPALEGALGLSSTPIAQFGTTDQRRQAILAWLRQAGNNSLDDIRATVQPYLLYADPQDIQILEPDRLALEAAHTYTGTGFALGAFASGSSTTTVLDDPLVSPAGAWLIVNLTGQIDELSLRLSGPGFSKAFQRPYLGDGSVVATSFRLGAKEFAGKSIRGTWTLFVSTQAVAATIHSWGVFVEGLGRNPDGSQGLGAAMFEFAIVADPGLVGTGYDLVGAQRAIDRFKPGHTLGAIIQQTGADACAIPDTVSAIPDRAIPCS